MNHAHSYLSKTELVKQLGYFPAFLIPAVNSSLIFRSLVQQTFSAYVNNPLPNLFKEKLFVCLSRYSGVSYFTICHSCTLLSLGMSASEILALQEITIPRVEKDIAPDLKILCDRWGNGKGWQKNPKLETSLLRCAYYIFLNPSQATNSIKTLQEILGNVYYNYLIVFLGYIKLCHQWVASNPSISHQQDRRSQLHLGSLLLSESKLGEFFHSNIQLENSRQKELESAIAFRDRASNSTNNCQVPQTTLANCLAYIPFPVMIHRHDDSILYLNRNWVEATGYNISDISTIAEWKQKARVEQNQIESESITPTISRQIKREIERIPQMGTQTKNMLEDIADSLSNLAEEMAQIKIEYRSEQSVTSRASITTSNGEHRFWELYSAPFCLGQEQEELTISIVKDITEIVAGTKKIADIEAKLDLVRETANLGYWSWNLSGNTIELCDLARDILGLAQFDGSYKSFINSIHPEARETVDLSLVKAIQTNRGLEIEYPIISSNYAIYWIRLKGKIRYNFAREVIGLTGVAMDITESKSKNTKTKYQYRLEQQTPVRQSCKQLANIIDLLPSYIFVVNIRDEKISLVNQKLATSLGLSDTQAIQGKTISEYFSSDYARQAVWQQQQVITYGKEVKIQEEVTLADGIHYFDTTIAPLRNEKGEIYALLHSFNDIPDLADTKKALSQRTLQLEAANTELESFSYSVSHDLQAPLRVINGFSQVLWENYEPILDDRGRHYLQRIQANSKKMSDLIDALLQLSRVTRTQMKSVTVNLSHIATEIFEELRSAEPDRQVEFTIGENLTACGDPQLLRIVLNNLLHNAWKYTSKRERAIIEFNLILEDGNCPTYYVRDNGAGFDLEYADKLFTAFKRLHTQEEFPGTGIGLATVKRIIYRHGGKVWADGEYDRGATIYFSL